MAHHAPSGKLVLFGGYPSYNDTWTWDGKTWTKETTVVSPRGRWGAAMAYDGQKVVLFGGRTETPTGPIRHNDTWSWDGSTWTPEVPSTAPPPRVAAAMAPSDDATRGLVLFGGQAPGGEAPGGDLADTWTWDGATWTERTMDSSTHPPARSNFSMAYDAAKRNAVLFGGFDARVGYLRDTWTWDGATSTWTERATEPATRPPGALRDDIGLGGHSMAYHEGTKTVVLFGGTDDGTSGTYHDETWSWDGAAWTKQQTVAAPSRRGVAAMAYHRPTERVVLFGGYGAGPQGDTWTWGKSSIAGDYDDNGTADVAIFRPSSGQWFVRGNAAFPVTYGTQSGDLPVPGDYDGDGTADIAIFRRSTTIFGVSTGIFAGTWHVHDNAAFPVTYGTQSDDMPVPGDYDGNGTTDVAVFRPSSGQWFVRGNAAFPVTYGTQPGDIPVPADYDGNGTTDVAVFRPSSGQWFVRGNAAFPVTYGTQVGDVPIPADFNGDRVTDVAIFRAGSWFIRNQPTVTFGTETGDIPVPADFDGDGSADVAIHRSSVGQWFVRNNVAFPVTYGSQPGDVPLQALYPARIVT